MSDTATAEPTLPAACARELRIAVMGAMKLLGGDMMMVDDDGTPDIGRLAKIGSDLVIVERPGHHARPKPHRFTCYRVTAAVPGKPFRLDPARALFVLHEVAIYQPPGWNLQLIANPHDWFNELMTKLYAALLPHLPRGGAT